MFYLFSMVIACYLLYVASQEGGSAALRKSFIVVALLAPTWMTYNVRSIRLDFRIVQAALAIGGLLVFPPPRQILHRLSITDLLVLALFLSLCLSQYFAGGLAPLTPLDIAATWLSTYVVGRVYFQSAQDLEDLTTLLSWLLALVCVLALIEAFAKTNVMNALLGKRFGILESGEGYRWGLKRAQGNVSHPIYNGFQQILFFPFALYLWNVGWRSRPRRTLAILSPLFLGATIVVTVSRGAQLGYMIACGVALFLMKPSWRILLAVLGIVGGLTLYAAKDALIENLGKMAGENTEEVRMLVIDGEEVEYTGTKHRLLLLQVYREPLQRAGWFGWGGALSGVQIDPELEQRFGSIDSHYVLFYLQYGKIGTFLFAAIMLSVILNMIRVAWRHSAWQPWAAGIAAAFISIGISMSSVWFAPDYAAIWLFAAGLAGNVKSVWLVSSTASEAQCDTPALPQSWERIATWLFPEPRRIPVTQTAEGVS